MKWIINLSVGAACLCLSLGHWVWAENIPSSLPDAIDPKLVYEIGGKAKVYRRRNRIIPVGAGIRWKMPSCGDFDMSLSVTNILNGTTGQLDKLSNDLVNSVTGVISNLPMMAIARSDPQLYEFLQQGKLEASALFEASVASCEEMTDKIITEGIGEGLSPSNWVTASGFEEWSLSSRHDDVVAKEKTIGDNQGDNGIESPMGGRMGGKNQPPIRVEKLGVSCGFNQLVNRPCSSQQKVQSREKPGFTEFWETPSAAENWISSVVGTTTIRTCKNCGERLMTTPGKGIYAVLEKEQHQLAIAIDRMVNTPTQALTPERLQAVSAPSYPVSQFLIEALRSENLYRSVFIERLAEDVATHRMVEYLIAARRILRSGKREAHIAQNSELVAVIDTRLNELKEEMALLKDDMALRRSLSSLSSQLLDRKQRRDRGSNTPTLHGDVLKALTELTGGGHVSE